LTAASSTPSVLVYSAGTDADSFGKQACPHGREPIEIDAERYAAATCRLPFGEFFDGVSVDPISGITFEQLGMLDGQKV
jgi:hypothetical protein